MQAPALPSTATSAGSSSAPLQDILRTPADIGLPYEDVWIPVASSESSTSEKLHGWYLPNPGSTRQTLLFCHGNYGNVGYNLERIRLLLPRWVSPYLAFDYRGFGLKVRAQSTATESCAYRKKHFCRCRNRLAVFSDTERQVEP